VFAALDEARQRVFAAMCAIPLELVDTAAVVAVAQVRLGEHGGGAGPGSQTARLEVVAR